MCVPMCDISILLYCYVSTLTPLYVRPPNDKPQTIYNIQPFSHSQYNNRYLHTNGEEALSDGRSSITPLAVNKEDRKRPRSHRYYSNPSTYSYLLGADIVVHPALYVNM